MERRLAAILAADVVGYSRLMGVDEEATLATLNVYREVIDRLVVDHRGRVFGSAGDSVIAEFASPVEAVRCAIEIQQEIEARNANLPEDRRMRFRIGINLGDVMAEGDNLFGDGVNVAARLEALCEGGGVALSGNVHEQVQGKLDERFEDAGEHEVKNIARPIRVWRWSEKVSGKMPTAAPGTEALPLPDKPSIAVLPFDNMSGDPEQDYFADGLCEDIIMALTQYPGLQVMARNSTFVYKGRAVDIATVARNLGVAYVLEGSVRKAGQRIRITAKLVTAKTGVHVWAERYDRDLNDIFRVQDEITLNIVTALGQRLSEGQYASESRKGTNSLEAWRAAIQGMASFADTSEVGIDRTLDHIHEAVRIDPDYAFAWGVLAQLYMNRVRYGWSRDLGADLARSFEAADRANGIDPGLAMAYSARGNALAFQRKFDDGVRELRRALELAPGSAFARLMLGAILNFCGRAEEGIVLIEEARRLDPHHSPWVLGVLGHGLRLAGRYDEALAVFSEHQTIRPTSAHDDRIITLVEMGRDAEAEEAAKKLLRIHPDFRTEVWAKRQFYKDPARLEKDLMALRHAGLE